MFVNNDAHGPLRRPLLSLPAIRECTSLDIFRPPSPLTVPEIIEWLNVDSRSDAPKCLDVGADHFSDSVDELLEHLKT
ncbi:hypothetical protein AAVH_31454, partial [Aphelenchoides avenae]